MIVRDLSGVLPFRLRGRDKVMRIVILKLAKYQRLMAAYQTGNLGPLRRQKFSESLKYTLISSASDSFYAC